MPRPVKPACLERAQRIGTGGKITGFVDSNGDGADDRDGLSADAAAAADRNGTRGRMGNFGQQIGTYQKSVVSEEARVVERVIPAVTKKVSRRVVKTPARTMEKVIPAVTKLCPAALSTSQRAQLSVSFRP